MSEQDSSKIHGLIILAVCVAIVIGGFLFNKLMKDNNIIDTYGDFIDKLHIKMDNMSCDELLDWAYEDSSYLAPAPPEQTYAKNLAREKCPNDSSWTNPPEPKPREIPLTMDELYDKWSKK